MDQESAAERFRIALELAEFAENMQRARLRREHPSVTDVEIEAAVEEWLASRPDAPFGGTVHRASSRKL